MTYFSNTSIDKELKKSSNKLFNLKKKCNKKTIFIVGFIFLLLIVLGFNFLKNKGYYIILDGDSEITIYEGTDYIELGYHGYDKNNNEVSELIKVDNQVNSSIVGKYEVTYTLKGATVKRYVNVIDKGVGETYINLSGDVEVYLKLGENYIEPGYLAIDTVDGDLTSKVIVNNQINTSKSGNYKIVYSVVNQEGVTTSVTRTVIILGADISLTLSNSNKTSNPITINITVNDNYFDYLILPNGSKITDNTYNYKVNSNGTYKFTSLDKFGNKTEKSITVSNIVTETEKTNENTSNENSNNQNNNTQNNNTSNNNTQNNNTSNNNTQNNNTSNNNTQNSNTGTTYYEQIKPKGNENIKYNVSTDTLKVWIELNERSGRTDYYTTHIWVRDAYNQFKSQVPDNFGKELLTAKSLLNNAVSQNNLQSKLVVGVNASGFVQYGLWGNAYYEANPAFEKTSKSPIVIVNGKVLRDLSSGTLPSSRPELVYGLNKSGNLTYYSYVGGNNTESNIATSNKIKNDGIKNTFSFYPVVVYNGVLKSTVTDQNIRQGFCQIDKNNFVFITDIFASARDGFTMKELGEYMLSLGCKTGFNLDGGGSTSLIFKDRNSSSIALTNTNRQLADIIYFHE